MLANKNILLLAPHTDDAELGAGGLINKCTRNGCTVTYVAFSATENRDQLISELTDALDVLHIPNSRVFNYPTRKFSAYRQSILDDMVKLSYEYVPDLVLCPSSDDTHQDHKVIREECFRAFKDTSIIGYECPQNNKNFRMDMFVKLDYIDIDKKIEAVNCYKSQCGKLYTEEEVIKGSARLRGAQVGTQLAEAFEVIRWIA